MGIKFIDKRQKRQFMRLVTDGMSEELMERTQARSIEEDFQDGIRQQLALPIDRQPNFY